MFKIRTFAEILFFIFKQTAQLNLRNTGCGSFFPFVVIKKSPGFSGGLIKEIGVRYKI